MTFMVSTKKLLTKYPNFGEICDRCLLMRYLMRDNVIQTLQKAASKLSRAAVYAQILPESRAHPLQTKSKLLPTSCVEALVIPERTSEGRESSFRPPSGGRLSGRPAGWLAGRLALSPPRSAIVGPLSLPPSLPEPFPCMVGGGGGGSESRRGQKRPLAKKR